MRVCRPIQYSDQTVCETCGLTWDTNDSAEPPCPFDPVDPIKPYPTIDQICTVVQFGLAIGAAMIGVKFEEPNAILTGVLLASTARLHLK